MPTPIEMCGLRLLRKLRTFETRDRGGPSACGGADAVSEVSVVIGREQQPAAGAVLLAGTGLEIAGGIELVGATRGQMLANTRAERAAKAHVPEAFVIRRQPNVHATTRRSAWAADGGAATLLARSRIGHAAKPDVGGGGVLRLRGPRRRAVAMAVLRRAQMRTAL